MNLDQVLEIMNTVMFNRLGRYLSDVETVVFRGAWQKQTYEQIAQNSCYSESYLKRSVGPQLWICLSKSLGEPVSKTNFREALERKLSITAREQLSGEESFPSTSQPHLHGKVRLSQNSVQASAILPRPRVDWGKAIDVNPFYGRTEELVILKQWIQRDRCRLLALLGMGGIGKTTLAVKLAEDIQADFDFVICRSLRHAPSVKDILIDLIQFFSGKKEEDLPINFDDQLLSLMTHLRSLRCLIILDHAESVLKSGDRTGSYRKDYEGYGQLLSCIGEMNHQSCLLFTSREIPKGFSALEGNTLPVRYLQLQGLSEVAGQQILQTKGNFTGSAADWSALIKYYTGNPLILKIVASSLNKFFEGNISGFLSLLKKKPFILDDVRDLINEQICRLNNLQKITLYWLSVARKSLTIDQLQKFFPTTILLDELLHGIESLKEHSLVHKTANKIMVDNLVADYTANYFVEVFLEEIIDEHFLLLKRYSLIGNQNQQCIKESQIHYIVRPLIKKLFLHFGSPKSINSHLTKVLDIQRDRSKIELECINDNFIYMKNYLKKILDNSGGINKDSVNILGINLYDNNLFDLEKTESNFTLKLTNNNLFDV